MGTFVLTFVGRSFTVWLQENNGFAQIIPERDLRRKLLVIGYFISIALIIGVFGVLTIPYIVREGADFISRLQAENIWYEALIFLPIITIKCCVLMALLAGSPVKVLYGIVDLEASRPCAITPQPHITSRAGWKENLFCSNALFSAQCI
jgi:energy-coupling factor transporter transmembrane protein EcfT